MNTTLPAAITTTKKGLHRNMWTSIQPLNEGEEDHHNKNDVDILRSASRYPSSQTLSHMLLGSSLQLLLDIGSNYGERLRAYYIPPIR